MKPTRHTCSTAYRDQNPKTRPPTEAARATTRDQQLLELSHAPPKILDSQLRYQSHAPPRRPCRPPIHLASESSNHTRSHAPTRAACVSGSFPCTATISDCVVHPLATRAVLSAMSTTDLPREEIWLSTNVARASTRRLGFWLLLHAPVNIAHSCQLRKTTADVI